MFEPEVQMWRSVLEQALIDAEGEDAEARRWFEKAGEDFLDVCTLAALPEGFVLRIYKGEVYGVG